MVRVCGDPTSRTRLLAECVPGPHRKEHSYQHAHARSNPAGTRALDGASGETLDGSKPRLGLHDRIGAPQTDGYKEGSEHEPRHGRQVRSGSLDGTGWSP